MASEDGRVRAVALSLRSRIQWDTLAIAASDVAYSGDGETIAFVCRDGGSWFYSFSADRWRHTRDHIEDVGWGVFSREGAYFTSADRSGMVVVRDM